MFAFSDANGHIVVKGGRTLRLDVGHYLKIASDRKSRIFILDERSSVQRSNFGEMQRTGDIGCAPGGNKVYECNIRVGFTLEISNEFAV